MHRRHALGTDPHRRELTTTGRPPPPLRHGQTLRWPRLAPAAQAGDERAGVDPGRHEHAHRVAGQAEHRHAAAVRCGQRPGGLRLAGLHGHLVEGDVALDHLPHHLERTHRHSPGRQHQVGRQRGGERGPEVVGVVVDGGRRDHLGAPAATEPCQEHRVGVGDPAEAERLPGGDELGARRQHGHPRPAHQRHAPMAERHGRGGRRRGPPQARWQPGLPRPDVFPPTAHVPALRHRLGDQHRLWQHHGARRLVGLLDRYDGVGAGRQRGPRHDAGGLSLAHRRHGRCAGGDVADDSQPRAGRQVGGTDGEPVHGGVVEGRHVDDGDQVGAQHAADAVRHRRLLDRQPGRERQYPREVFLDRAHQRALRSGSSDQREVLASSTATRPTRGVPKPARSLMASTASNAPTWPTMAPSTPMSVAFG